MTIRLIALDLDGTTLTPENTLTERTKQALSKAASFGAEIVPVTGRCFKSLPQELLEIDDGQCIRYAVTSNGAQIRDIKTGETIYENYIAPSSTEEMKKILDKLEVMIEVYVKGSAYIEMAYYKKVAKGEVTYRDRNYVLNTRLPVRGVRQLLEVHKGKVEKVAVYFDPGLSHEMLKQTMRQMEHVSITSSGPNNVEMMAENCSKAGTLQVLCRRLGLPMEEVMAAGDSQNDLEMLRAAGLSVAMGNAEENVKAMADWVTDRNDQDGLAKAIEKYCINCIKRG